jgi:hypothetical protein
MKLGYKSQEQLAAERSVREAKREEREQKYGELQPDAEEKKRIDSAEMAARAADVAKRAAQAGGATDEQAMAAGEAARSFSQATPAERYFAEARRRDKEMLGGFKTYGDKARFDQMNAVRKLQGREALDADPLKQFDKDMSKSMAFGAESSLNTPEGRQRAMKAGVKAGLSFNDADAAVQGAFKRLQEIGKRDKVPIVVPPLLARPEDKGTTTTAESTPKPPVEVTPTPVKPSAVSEVFLGENQEGAEGSPTRGVIRGTKAGATIYGALEKKVGGAKNIVEEYNKSGIGSRLDDLKTSAADTTKTAERAAARMQKFEDTWKGKSPKAGSASERAAVSEYNNLKERLDTAKGNQAASNKLAQEASEAASKAAAAEKVVGGIGGKIVEAGEKVGKFFGPLAKTLAPVARVARPLAPVARIVGRAAGPAFELYDAAKYFTGDEGEKAKYAESAATLGSRLFTPKSGGEFLGAVGDVLSPTKNVLGVVESGRQLSRSSRDARESEAAADTAQKLFDARQAARRADYTDEQFKALSQKERTDYLKKLRERVKVK